MEAAEHRPNPSRDLHLNTVSTVDAAANVLRELILDGELEPGSRLREAEFAERLGIARHSFRAATQVLISEGMLRREPHRGVQVTVLDAGRHRRHLQAAHRARDRGRADRRSRPGASPMAPARPSTSSRRSPTAPRGATWSSPT